MTKKSLKGAFPLMPFVLKNDQDLDLLGLKENVGKYQDVGFDGYIAFGCMGEFYAPSMEEYKKVVDVAVGSTSKIACVFGATFQNTRECLLRTKYAQDAGADGVMVGLPYLVPCTEEAAFEHFRQLNDVADEIQIMVYNNPYSFRFNITSEFWDKLMQLDRIKAVKESNPEVLHRARVISHIRDRINVFSGGEFWLLGDSLLGAKGIVSMAGPGVPEATLQLFDLCERGDVKHAIPLHVMFANLFRKVTSENEVAWLKACAEFGGIKSGPPRSPYPPLQFEEKNSLWTELSNIRDYAANHRNEDTVVAARIVPTRA